MESWPSRTWVIAPREGSVTYGDNCPQGALASTGQCEASPWDFVGSELRLRALAWPRWARAPCPRQFTGVASPWGLRWL
jgi:hypothetical protein